MSPAEMVTTSASPAPGLQIARLLRWVLPEERAGNALRAVPVSFDLAQERATSL